MDACFCDVKSGYECSALGLKKQKQMVIQIIGNEFFKIRFIKEEHLNINY